MALMRPAPFAWVLLSISDEFRVFADIRLPGRLVLLRSQFALPDADIAGAGCRACSFFQRALEYSLELRHSHKAMRAFARYKIIDI